MAKRKAKKQRLIEVCGYTIDSRTRYVQNGTIPVDERSYYGSRLSKDIECYDEKTGRFKNVELFSPVIYDLEHKPPEYSTSWEVYDDPNKKSKKIIRVNYPKKYLDYWYEERRRCLEGYSIGGVDLDGPNYFYLNFWRIKGKKRGSGYIVPRFLDLDKQFFELVQQARDEEKNIMFLKRRQIGFSEKVAALAAYEYTFYNASETLIIAGLDAYAENTSFKCRTGLDAFSPDKANAARPFYKRRKAGSDKIEKFMSGYKTASGVVKGYESKVFAITTKDNAQAASGKSPTLVIMEEAGINPLLKRVYSMVVPSIEEMGSKDGRIVVFIGTGGEMDKGVAQMMSMFYNPEKYDLLAVENIWDSGIPPGTQCCPFFPAWKYYVMDYDGNSYKEPSMFLHQKNREKLKNDKKALHDEKTQYPFTPSEAFSVSGLSPFNTEKLTKQRKILLTENWEEKLQYGNLEWIYSAEAKANKKTLFSDGKANRVVGVRWVPAPAGKESETDSEGDAKYPYLIIEHPERPKSPTNDDSFDFYFNDPIFDGLYGGGTDPYDKPRAPTSDSEGSCTIYKGYKDANSTSNLFVARVTWRPSKPEKFFDSTLKLCCYYNMCQNLIEWSNVTIFDYYKNHGFEYLLKERPQVTYANKPGSKVDNKYGVDPNTKHIWESRYATYIEEYCFNMYDIESVQRALAYRKSTGSKRHNCDITISNMLSLEHMVDNSHIGIEVDNRTNAEENNTLIGGFFEVEGEIKYIHSSEGAAITDTDGFYS